MRGPLRFLFHSAKFKTLIPLIFSIRAPLRVLSLFAQQRNNQYQFDYCHYFTADDNEGYYKIDIDTVTASTSSKIKGGSFSTLVQV